MLKSGLGLIFGAVLICNSAFAGIDWALEVEQKGQKAKEIAEDFDNL